MFVRYCFIDFVNGVLIGEGGRWDYFFRRVFGRDFAVIDKAGFVESDGVVLGLT